MGCRNEAPLPSWPVNEDPSETVFTPFDEGQKNQEFAHFRQELYTAVQKKDLHFFKNTIADQIELNKTSGKSAFLQTYQLDENPSQSRIWFHLKNILELGGGFENEDKFIAPYIFVTKKLLHPYKDIIVIGDDIPLKQQPERTSKTIRTLSWEKATALIQETVQTEEIDGLDFAWLKAKDAQGNVGYLSAKNIYMRMHDCLTFEKIEGQWKITSLKPVDSFF